MVTDSNDKGVRKFRAMIIGLSFLFAGYVLAGWRGWTGLFSEYAWGVAGLVVSFTVPNVAEKIFRRGGTKPKPPA